MDGERLQRHHAHRLVERLQPLRVYGNGVVRCRLSGMVQALLDCHDLVIIGFGGAAWRAIQGIGENRTPWAGDFERINAYPYFA